MDKPGSPQSNAENMEMQSHSKANGGTSHGPDSHSHRPASPISNGPKLENPFAFSLHELQELLDPKNPGALANLGGVEGIMKGLKVDGSKGLPHELTPSDHGHSLSKGSQTKPDLEGGHDSMYGLEKRRQIYGRNVLPPIASKSVFQLMWAAIQDKTLVHQYFLLSLLSISLFIFIFLR